MVIRDGDEELLTALFARLAADEPSIKVFTVVPEDQVPPYVTVDLMESQSEDSKDGITDHVTTEWSVYSTGAAAPGAASMIECLRLRNRVIKALTRTPYPILENGFVVDDVQRTGRSMTDEFSLSYIYFHGTARLRWRVRDSLSGG